MSADTADSILRFWFGSEPERAASDKTRMRLWWSKSDSIDEEIRRRFESSVHDAIDGRLNEWAATPTGLLALILLADQFPRNIYRDTPQAFESDTVARSWCVRGIEESMDRRVLPIQRLFWYLPLEHSESLADQDRCVRLVGGLIAEADETDRPAFEGFLDYAERHREIIRRFGRFPHRNAILGRESTPEELAFLETPGSSF